MAPRRTIVDVDAPNVTGWVLLEHPGPWGGSAAHESALVPERLRAAARDRNLRVHLVRQHGRRARGSAVFLARTTGPNQFVERLRDADDLDTDALDLIVAGRPTGRGPVLPDPLYLTCTHGRVDAWCAIRGRPVARALAAAAPGRAWESTHVGGCRFAANVVCLPSGVYYGRMTAAEVAGVVEATDSGAIALPWYRGRADLPAPAQVGERFLRSLTGLERLADIRFTGFGPGTATDVHDLRFTCAWGEYELLLRAGATPSAGFEVVSIVEHRHPVATR